MFPKALKVSLLMLVLFTGPSLAQMDKPTITDVRSGSGTLVTDNTDQEMDHGVTLWVLGGFGVVTVTLLVWYYLRRRDRIHERAAT